LPLPEGNAGKLIPVGTAVLMEFPGFLGIICAEIQEGIRYSVEGKIFPSATIPGTKNNPSTFFHLQSNHRRTAQDTVIGSFQIVQAIRTEKVIYFPIRDRIFADLIMAAVFRAEVCGIPVTLAFDLNPDAGFITYINHMVHK
jgi:hypothetical protein